MSNTLTANQASFWDGLSDQLRPTEVPGPVHGEQHAKRRARLAEHMAAQGGGVAIVSAGDELIRNRDSHFPFRSHSDFLYMTGFPEPQAWWIMRVDANGKTDNVLVCRPRDAEREIWDGVRVGPELAALRYQMDCAVALDALDQTVIDLARNQPALYAHVGASRDLDQKLRDWLDALRGMGRAGVTVPDRLIDIGPMIAKQRLIKDRFEIATMARAGEISAKAHCRAMQRAHPGIREHELEAELIHEFRQAGAQSVAYNSIVASGPHSCVLHHRAGDRAALDGELILIDAGCELDGYASDITRTFPVNGRFTAEQRAVYDVVLAAQAAAIQATCRGAAFNAPHDAATTVLTQGMIDLRLIAPQSLESAIQSGDFKRFYMHRTGHWLGLDVHDVGDYNTPLTEGMVMTVEPGLYIRPAEDIPQAFWNIGVRIEDDVLLGADTPEILTHGVPVEADAIEALMQTSR